MIVIADSNIFVSALITPQGVTATILTERSRIQFIAPDYMIEEVKDHYDKIMYLAGKTRQQIDKEFKQLLEGITILGFKDIAKKNFAQAYDLVKDIDIDDAPFVALHLQTGHKIWTGDDKLKEPMKKKGYGHFFITTAEIRKNLYKKSD